MVGEGVITPYENIKYLCKCYIILNNLIEIEGTNDIYPNVLVS